MKPYMWTFAGHYASDCHEQKSSNCPHQSKIKKGRPCAVHVCANWCWLWSLKLSFWSCALPVDVGVHEPSLGVTSNLLPRPPQMAWQRPRWRTQVAQSGCCQCVKGCWLCGGPPHAGSGLGGCVVECHRRHCLVRTSGGRSKFLGEWASLKNGMVLLWACSGPPFWLVHWVYKCTLAATPLQRM